MSELERAPEGGEARRFSLTPEDQARADFYALLARLYASAPDLPLLQAIAAAPALDGPAFIDPLDSKAAQLRETWDAVRAASSVIGADAAAQEYVDLFVGVGKCEINLHASHWLTGFMMEKPLAEVRATLALLGIGRKADAIMVEDHLSALCEAMRLLIAGHAGRAPMDVTEQRRFFDKHIAPWAAICTGAIRAHPIANYYRRVADFTESFVALEHESFAID